MKTIFLACILFLGVASATPVVNITPGPSGAIGGYPGQTVGWGFDILGDSDFWVSFVSSQLIMESNPSLGIYTDYIGVLGGPTTGALAPNAVWQQAFNRLSGLGIGEYAIDPFAVVGSVNDGLIFVTYETFLDNPSTCGGCLLGTGFLTLPFSVTVSDTPEPATSALLAAGLIALSMATRRRR